MANFNLSAIIGGKPCLFKRKAVSVGSPPNADEDAVSLNRFDRAASGRLDRQCSVVALHSNTSNLGTRANDKALFLENLG